MNTLLCHVLFNKNNNMEKNIIVNPINNKRNIIKHGKAHKKYLSLGILDDEGKIIDHEALSEYILIQKNQELEKKTFYKLSNKDKVKKYIDEFDFDDTFEVLKHITRKMEEVKYKERVDNLIKSANMLNIHK